MSGILLDDNGQEICKKLETIENKYAMYENWKKIRWSLSAKTLVTMSCCGSQELLNVQKELLNLQRLFMEFLKKTSDHRF